ncbi:cell division protein FtsZ [bacterium]|nr:cell division protein FtsZ [bacterium]
MVRFIEETEETEIINVKVVGVGNAGGNIITRISDKIDGVSFVIFNTDAQSLKRAKADVKIHIGEKTTHGRGTGRDPQKGMFAANEDKEKISEVLKNTNIVFLVAGLGGGTGTGSSPIIAKTARELGAIVISFVITPFAFEGERRMEHAKKGLDNLLNNVDTLIHISNQKLFDTVGEKEPISSAFAKIDEMILRTVEALSDLIYKPKLLDIDFADICSIVENAGKGIVGLGSGKGAERIIEATKDAIEGPLIEKSEMMEAKNILISITGSSDLTLKEIGDAMNMIQTRIASPSRVLGVAIDEQLEDEVKITLLATGIGKSSPEVKKSPPKMKKEDELPLAETEEKMDVDTPAFLRKKGGN